MAQQTTELWKDLFDDRNVTFEYKFKITDPTTGSAVEYGKDKEISHSVTQSLYNNFGFGNAVGGQLDLTLLADNIPRSAKIERFVRLVLGNETSEWLQKGTFFTSTRSYEDGVWTIEAFDAMKKADAPYLSAGDQTNYPKSERSVVREIAERIGVTVDSRTVVSGVRRVQFPGIVLEDGELSPNGNITMRTMLQAIAAANGGNWIITDTNTLLLIGLDSLPEETFYLIDERHRAITFGGDRIIV